MSYTFRAANEGHLESASSSMSAGSISVQAGDLVLAYFSGADSGQTFTSVTDASSNSYTACGSVQRISGAFYVAYWARANATTTITPTAALSANTTYQQNFSWAADTTDDLVSPVDGSVVLNTDTGSTAWSSGSYTSSEDDEVAVTFTRSVSPNTTTSPATERADPGGLGFGSVSDRALSTAGTYSTDGTKSNAGDSQCYTVLLMTASGGGGSTSHSILSTKTPRILLPRLMSH